MLLELVEIPDLTGIGCRIFSVRINGEEDSLFDKFVIQNYDNYPQEIEDIYNRLKFIGKEGAREQFFKHNEGRPGDLVCALYDNPDHNLRLYCIRFGGVAVVLGSGGFKSKKTRRWQDDPVLTENARMMMLVSSRLNKAVKDGDLKITDKGLSGNFKLTDDYECNE